MSINKRLIGAFSLLMAMVMCVAAFAPVNAQSGGEDPAVAAFSKTDLTGSLISFSPEDFTSRVTGNETLKSMIIASLPEGGSLRLAGNILARGESVDISDTANLCFIPDTTGETQTSFTFLPVFSDSGAGSESVTVSLSLSSKKNSAPIAQDLSFETYVNVKLCGELKYNDVDGDECSFTIVQEPKKGTVEVTDSGFAYIPKEGKTGKDSFTYTAVDPSGSISQEAVVDIVINKRSSKDTFVYTDMMDSPNHYAALKLREEGVLSGETIGSDSFLYPDKAVSRAEFVALVAAVTEMAAPTMAVGTGLSDNEDIPTWAQPYVAAAVNLGVVQGERASDGNRVFRAQDGITRAEAASIVNRAFSLANDGRSLQFSDSRGIPAWSVQSVINAEAAGIVPAFSDNTFRANDFVTRDDAVKILFNMMNYQQKDSGGWSFWK